MMAIRVIVIDHDGVEFIEPPRDAMKAAMLALCDDLAAEAFRRRDIAATTEARDLRDRVKALT